MEPVFRYPCEVVRVLDADTMEVRIDRGWRDYSTRTVRLAGVDTPELKTVDGRAARDWVTGWIAEHGRFCELISVEWQEKFGRTLARLHWTIGGTVIVDLADELIREGYGRPYAGGKRV